MKLVEGDQLSEENGLNVPPMPIPTIPDCLPEGLREQVVLCSYLVLS